jgi:hypothetical protein
MPAEMVDRHLDKEAVRAAAAALKFTVIERPMTLVRSRVQSWPNAELARSRPNMGARQDTLVCLSASTPSQPGHASVHLEHLFSPASRRSPASELNARQSILWAKRSLSETIEAGQEMEAPEEWILERVLEGRKLLGLYPPNEETVAEFRNRNAKTP